MRSTACLPSGTANNNKGAEQTLFGLVDIDPDNKYEKSGNKSEKKKRMTRDKAVKYTR